MLSSANSFAQMTLVKNGIKKLRARIPHHYSKWTSDTGTGNGLVDNDGR